MASALRAAAVPMVDLSRSRFAAGVSPPSALLGVHEGGAIDPFVALPPTGVRDMPDIPSRPAFARRLFDAFVESLCDSRSRGDGSAMRNGVFGVAMEDSIGSSDWDKTRGVPVSVPQVTSCLTACGPSSEGVGDGIEGTSEKLPVVGDFGRSVSCSLVR